MIKQILISLAMVAAAGTNATVNAQQRTAVGSAAVADSTHKKSETVKHAKTVAPQTVKSKVAETKKAVANAHKTAAQRRLEENKRRLEEDKRRLEREQEQLEKESENLGAAMEDIADGDDGMEAYSDTSSTSSNGHGGGNISVDDSNRYNPARFTDPFSWIAFMCTSSFWGVLLTIFVMVLIFLFFAMPFILLIVIVRYLVRRHNDRVRLAEMAMKQGRPFDEIKMSMSRKPRSYMWRRGVRNLSLGVGLVFFFWCLGAEPLVGIGGLVACMGAGQMFMARNRYDAKPEDKPFGDGDFFADDLQDNTADDIFGPKDTAGKPAENDNEETQGRDSVKE
mgnify:CR=1 FL=1